jgi:hypothetical protein
MINKAILGYDNEKDVVILFNKNKSFINNIYSSETLNTFAIHVNSKKYGKLNEKNVSCKSDFYLANGNITEDELLERNYYLNENDIEFFKLKPIINTGVSVKLDKSRYTIFKMGPTTFKKLFQSNVLASGASIYSTKDFDKNGSVLDGWEVKKEEFYTYYSDTINGNENYLSDKVILNKIKKKSNKEIKKIIENNKSLSDFIFKGIGNFEEPFTAHWLFENNELKKNYEIPFQITTGSGRSKGIFTIVLKPI